MNWVVVPNNQALKKVLLTVYGDESDTQDAPVPTNLPIELYDLGLYFDGDPIPSYSAYQQASGGDRHAIVLRLGDTSIFEWWQMRVKKKKIRK